MKKIKWDKLVIVALDILLGVYLVMAFTSFNKPDESTRLCTKVNIIIQDEATNGFIDRSEIESRLRQLKLFPIDKPLSAVSTRSIEEALMTTPFVSTAQCYKTQNGHINISITQRMPIVRIKSEYGDDYYLDDNDCVMPNSNYTSDLIVATGAINRDYATAYISPLSKTIMANDLWKNLVEQINILPDKSVEIVPRVGNHIVNLGPLPENKSASVRYKLINEFVTKKMTRLEKFYKYGLSVIGWNKYSYINLEFDNQIICKKRHTNTAHKPVEKPQEETEKPKENTDKPQENADRPSED